MKLWEQTNRLIQDVHGGLATVNANSHFQSFEGFSVHMLTLPVLSIRESCIEITLLCGASEGFMKALKAWDVKG